MGVISDPIGDLLARIKNGQMRGQTAIACPHSKIKHQIARILTEEGFIRGYKIISLAGNKQVLKLYIKYKEHVPAIKGLVRISRPGRKVYTKLSALPGVRGGMGITILSTPRGVFTDKQARMMNVGGEVLCKVW